MYDASTDGKVTELGSLGALASYPTNVSALSFETQLPLLEYQNVLIVRITLKLKIVCGKNLMTTEGFEPSLFRTSRLVGKT